MSDTKTLTARELVRRRKAKDVPKADAAPNGQTQSSVPARKQSTVVALPDNRDYRQRYLDDVAPSFISGRLIKFAKEGRFITPDDEQPVANNVDFIALVPDTQIGWVKYNGEDEPPARVQGPLYGGFVMPPREDLGDNDPAEWAEGLDGQPADPWVHQQLLVLQRRDTNEVYTFSTTSKTGRRAVGTLCRHYDRLRRMYPNALPIVQLRESGFQHRDERIGWVATPNFVVVGSTTEALAVKPDTPIGEVLNDAVPLL
jgi:hypothetical protein